MFNGIVDIKFLMIYDLNEACEGLALEGWFMLAPIEIEVNEEEDSTKAIPFCLYDHFFNA